MFNGLKSIARDRARRERDRVIIESMIQDSKIADAFLDLDENVNEDASDEELEALIDKIPETDDDEIDDQINNILGSDEDLDVDGILGVDDTSECTI